MTEDILIPINGAANYPPCVCAGCGCACDDLTANDVHIACEVGRKWFEISASDDEPPAWVSGQPVKLATAIDAAAELLSAARSPLITGLTYTTCEAQIAAIDLAETLGSVIDPLQVPRRTHGTLLQNVGLATASFGALRDRADFVLLWNCDPANGYPRFFERYCDTSKAHTLQVTDDLAAVAVLRALLRGIPLSEKRVLRRSGKPLSEWQHLLAKLLSAKYAVVVLPMLNEHAAEFENIAQLVRELNETSRTVAISLSPGNAVGAAQVLTSQTGYPCCVDFATGTPRFDPRRFDATKMLARGEIDVLLVVGDEVPSHSRNIAVIHIDSRSKAANRELAVQFHTARPGVQCAGTTFRADGIALPLQNRVDSTLVDDAACLRAITERLLTRV